jgi:cytidyltransferase-like protein
MTRVLVSECFDDLRSPDIRFLQEASRFGRVHILLWSDEAVRRITGRPPRFPQDERLYLLQSLRSVGSVSLTGESIDPDAPAASASRSDVWMVDQRGDNPRRKAAARSLGMDYHVIPSEDLAGFPIARESEVVDAGLSRKALVTGCFDWFHSGHVRFFEEVSALGALYVVVGNDKNLRLLKGDGHPFFSQEERRYQVASVRFVTEALISTGNGWLDAEPEIGIIKPDIYAVNEDGDKPEKKEFCVSKGIEYVVLHRAPRPGLPRRTSTDLRGFSQPRI